MTDICKRKRPAAGFLAAGLLFGLLVLPCGCRPSPAFAQSAALSTPVPLIPAEESEGPDDSPVVLYEQPGFSDDCETDTETSEAIMPEKEEDPDDTASSFVISEAEDENTEANELIAKEQDQEAPAEGPEEEGKEEEPETVPGAEVTEEIQAEDPEPAPPSTASYSTYVSAGDSGVDPYYVQLAADAYQQAPQWVRTLFENAGWQICVRSGGYFGAVYGYHTSLLGLTVYDEGNIYISAQEAACNRHIICHELGHFIDWWYGFLSSSTEFSNIYNAEYSTFCSYFSYSNGYPTANELFAEALYHYWTDPGNLLQAVPGTYAYIQNTFG